MQYRSIQVLRGVAAISVVLLHATINQFERGPGTFYWGAAGVDLFFVISGFIIATVSQRETPETFALRRFIRVFPLWWIASLPWLVHYRTASPADLTLWPIWGGKFAFPQLIIGWSLYFEVLFYVAVLLAMVTRPAVPLTIFAACFATAFWTGSALIDFLGNPMILCFLGGVALTKVPRDERFGLPLIGLGLVGIAAAPTALYDGLVILDHESALFRAFLYGIPAVLIVHGALSLERIFQHRWWRPAIFLGGASYSIYLFHLLTMLAVLEPWWLSAAVAIAAGIAGHLVFERPILSILRQRTRQLTI